VIAAAHELRDADVIAVTASALCEFVWVMARGYKRTSGEILGMIRNLLEGATVRVDRPAIEAGLVILEAGGDFADGVIAFEGGRLAARCSSASIAKRSNRSQRAAVTLICSVRRQTRFGMHTVRRYV
jgi:predicted nucleic-acid-binding protein